MSRTFAHKTKRTTCHFAQCMCWRCEGIPQDFRVWKREPAPDRQCRDPKLQYDFEPVDPTPDEDDDVFYGWNWHWEAA